MGLNCRSNLDMDTNQREKKELTAYLSTINETPKSEPKLGYDPQFQMFKVQSLVQVCW